MRRGLRLALLRVEDCFRSYKIIAEHRVAPDDLFEQLEKSKSYAITSSPVVDSIVTRCERPHTGFSPSVESPVDIGLSKQVPRVRIESHG